MTQKRKMTFMELAEKTLEKSSKPLSPSVSADSV